ncbi:hypothetical protein ACJMK2_036666 [Sinanodonta woodiana]|uniref:receptor protein-tyrosine kinase n=1 Tax=Sinanodonta woodiana TaxID=1069815 RepID=A0ABD3WHX9_SINWO
MGTIKTCIVGAIITFVMYEIICSEAQASCLNPPTTKCDCQVVNNKSIINCRDKSLTQIPTFNNTNIEYDELTFSTAQLNTPTCSSCNKITSIPSRAFANLKVRRIDLTKNALVNISDNSFAGVEPYLKELLLEGNGTKEPNYAALANLTGLATLHLENFQQTQFSSNNIFGYLQNLENLILKSFKSLSLIDGATFLNKVPKLKTFRLEDSPLTTYPAGVFLNIPSLQVLSFINTQVTKLLAQSFNTLNNLKELDLSHNIIDSIDNDTFAAITDTLEFLNLAVNKLGNNNKRENLFFLSSKTWTKLELLTLSYNVLDAIPDRTFQNMPNLAYLTLQGCQLSSISSGLLQGLQNLHTLEVSLNWIANISVNAFVHTPQLTDLRLDQQHKDSIKDIALNFPPTAVEPIRTSLNRLNLQQNQVNESQIWEIIRFLINLEELYLSSTNLVTVPDFVFRYITKLQILDLSYNQLTSVNQKSFHGLKDTITSITLSENNLTTIDECVFKNFSKLNHLFLSENIWNCDCHLLWLYDWINVSPGIADLVDCVCHSPPSLIGKQIQNVNRQDLFCTPTNAPYTCPDYYITTTTTTTTTPIPLPVFRIAITAARIFSINVSWTISDKSDVTRYLLSLVDLQNTGSRNLWNLSRDTTLFQFSNLKPQQLYNICLQVELNNVLNQNLFSCVNYSTKPIPAFELLTNTITESSIEVKWTVSDMTEITGFRLHKVIVSTPTDKYYEIVTKDGSTFQFKNLKSGESYQICLELIINGQVYEKDDKCKTIQTNTTNTTDQPKVTAEPQTSNEKIPIIVGSVVGALLITVIVAIIVYILIRKKSEKYNMNTERSELPHAGQTTRTFTKSKPGAAKVDDIQIKVISNGNVNDTSRVSGGSYQFLSERDSRNVNPEPSTSTVNPHYINDIRSHMLPNPPGKGSQAPHPHAYVNTG